MSIFFLGYINHAKFIITKYVQYEGIQWEFNKVNHTNQNTPNVNFLTRLCIHSKLHDYSDCLIKKYPSHNTQKLTVFWCLALMPVIKSISLIVKTWARKRRSILTISGVTTLSLSFKSTSCPGSRVDLRRLADHKPILHKFADILPCINCLI